MHIFVSWPWKSVVLKDFENDTQLHSVNALDFNPLWKNSSLRDSFWHDLKNETNKMTDIFLNRISSLYMIKNYYYKRNLASGSNMFVLLFNIQ